MHSENVFLIDLTKQLQFHFFHNKIISGRYDFHQMEIYCYFVYYEDCRISSRTTVPGIRTKKKVIYVLMKCLYINV